MKQIWKFTLAGGAISVPKGAEFLSCYIQRGEICVWMLVDPKATPEMWRYQIIGTGHDFNPEGLEHFATIQDSSFVWHLFWERG